MKKLSAEKAWPKYRKFFNDWLADEPTTRPEDLPFRQEPQAFNEFWEKVLEDPALAQKWAHRFELGYTAWKRVALRSFLD